MNSITSMETEPNDQPKSYVRKRLEDAIAVLEKSIADLKVQLSMREDADVRRELEFKENELKKRRDELDKETESQKRREETGGQVPTELIEDERLREERQFREERLSSGLLFENREDELKDLLAEDSRNYRVITAPAGYGKTALLRKLEEKYRERNWSSALLTVEDTTDLADLLKKLSAALFDGRSLLNSGLGPEHAGRQLADLIQNRLSSEKKRGLVLLFDLARPSFKTVERPPIDQKELILGVISGIDAGLRRLPDFKDSACQFRVLVASRHADDWLRPETRSFPFVPKPLTPFSFDVVYLLVDQLWRPWAKSEKDQLAAYLMHHTGGHPGTLVDVLRIYNQEYYPETENFFVEQVERFSWQKVVIDRVEWIYNGIPEKLRKILDILSVFRVLDHKILNALLGNPQEILKGLDSKSRESLQKSLPNVPPIEWGGSAEDLANILTNTQLMEWDSELQLLMSEVVRRLLALRWLKSDPTGFINICWIAKAIYDARVCQADDDGRAIRWATEMLFQELQQAGHRVASETERLAFRAEFLSQQVPYCIAILKNNRQADRLKSMFVRTLEERKDRELEFVINFFLRAKSFTDEPYQAFISAIQASFAREML